MLRMRKLLFCVLAIITMTPAQGEENERPELHMESVGSEELLECFRCDLGFWDTCYTTETNCSLGEKCYTGRGKAADVLDVKTLGCVRAEECGVETAVELLENKTIFIMTKHCCDTPFCNSAHKPPVYSPLYLTVAFFTTWCISEAFMGIQYTSRVY